MAKRKQRAARIASVALLGSTVFANPPPAGDKPRTGVVLNQPNPAPEQAPLDAGTADLNTRPVIVNQAPMRPPPTINRMPTPREEHLLLPDGGTETRRKK
ncbi:MAG: hypothetical protein ABTQ32_23285 [Myxococcaceae bacterium]